MAEMDWPRRLTAEALGTLLLVATVIGSGIMGEALAGGNAAIALLGNTLATGAILAVLILVFAPLSGAHFNPAVTFAFLMRRDIAAGLAGAYVLAQIAGGLAGMVVAHAMFDLPLIQSGLTVRSGGGQWIGEVVATFGLVATILGCLRTAPSLVPYAVALFISAGYWFTSSTSFANPAVTIARAFTETFSGIRPLDVPPFLVAQLAGAALAALLAAWLWRPQS